jgi:hypothetical protein
MSYDDDHRGNPQQPRERGAYTPPTDDDLMFERRGGYDSHRQPAQKSPPITLIVSAVVLLLLIVAVVLFYRSGVRSSEDAPAVVGTPVESMKVEAPIDAQPLDPEEGVRVYRDGGEVTSENPTFTPGPEAVAPRPEPREVPVPAPAVLPPAAPAAKAPAAPAPVVPAPVAPKPVPAPAPAPKAEPAPAAATGNSAVQIGAFSSQAIADREYAAVAGRFGQFTSGASKTVTPVQTANGSTHYRTTISGLSRERAVAFCNALKAAGKDCLVR